MLADDPFAAGQVCRQVQVFVDHRPHHAPDLHQLGEDIDDGIEIAPVVEVSRREDEVSDARFSQVELPRHELLEALQVMADNLAHGVGDPGHQGMVAADHLVHLRLQRRRVSVPGKAAGKELEDLRIAVEASVGQCQKPVPDIPDGGHLESLPQPGRAAARIERCDDVDGVVGILDELGTGVFQGAAAAEEQKLGTQLRRSPVPGQLDRIRQPDVTRKGDDHAASFSLDHNGPSTTCPVSRNDRQHAAALSKSIPPLNSRTSH